tara:strand:+ start:159 stop:347 length:189 start_codon:yes stop_codon:yes gene_type:complete
VKVGDLVWGREHEELAGGDLGIVIEVIDTPPETLPPVVKILWQDGTIDKEWTDDIAVINEAR